MSIKTTSGRKTRSLIYMEFSAIVGTFAQMQSSYATHSEQQLVSLLKEGDHVAYQTIYERYFGLLFVHAHKRLRDEEQAKDIVQEFFTALWHRHEEIQLTTSLSAYFFTAINYRIISFFRRSAIQDKYIASFAGFINSEQINADHLIREKQLSELIEREIQELPPKMREVFEMSRKQHLSHKEIAEKLSLSEKTVDRQVSNALHRLRSKLGLLKFLIFLIKY